MSNITPSVDLIAYTKVTPAIEKYMSRGPEATDAEHLIEFSGRNCYDSFHRPNPKTAKNSDYIQSTFFDKDHGSISEHANATLFVTGVSRPFLTEFTRHRPFSFSVRSQRFVNEESANFILPPAVRDFEGEGHNENLLQEALLHVSETTSEAYGVIVEILQDRLEEEGLPKFAARKQAREAARSVLPNMVETHMVITANFRAWHETLTRRMAPDADAEMREVALLMWNTLTEVSPVVFPHREELWQAPSHPVQLVTEEDYQNAPEGTVIEDPRDRPEVAIKNWDGRWEVTGTPNKDWADVAMAEEGTAKVLRWGEAS